LEAAALFSPKQSTFGDYLDLTTAHQKVEAKYDELISEFLLEIT